MRAFLMAVLWAALVSMAGAALAQPAPATPAPAARGKNLPLPDLSKGVELRVAYVENPRFAPLAGAQIDAVLAQAAAAMKQHFGVEVRFTKAVRLDIAPLFAALSPRRVREAEALRLDPSDDLPTREKLARALLKDMKLDGDIPAQKRFATPYLLQAPADGSDLAFARALIATQHQQLQAWHQTPALDGRPLLGKDRYNEYTYWNVLGSARLPYEVLITNQLIASAEWTENTVHSAVRGGVSNGITTQSRDSRFELYSVVSSYPFMDPSPQALRLRGGEQPSAEQAARYMGLMLAHELGHQLLHLGHPFNNASCLMTPPVQLDFRQWADGLSAANCTLGSSKNNTAGAIKFERPEVLFK